MKRKAGAMILLAAMSGCMTGAPNAPGTYMSHVNQPAEGGAPACGVDGAHCGARLMNGSPNLVGPSGEPMMAMAPAAVPQMTPESLALQAVAQGLPPGVIDQIDKGHHNAGLMQVSATMPGNGPMGGGVMQAGGPMGPPPGAVAAVGALTGACPNPFPIQRTSVRFIGPSGMKISWYGPTPNGQPGFGGEYLTAPGRYNFLQAAIYRLKLTDIPLRQGLELYPTLEVVPVNAKTATFLAHSSVPVNITEEDLNQVAAGNFVVKVIYLPDPQYQDLASTGAEEIISSRLEPGADPVAEALRRGSILLIVRLGNILLELPNTPPMDAPSPYQARQQQMMMGMQPGMPMAPGMAAGGMPQFGPAGNVPPGMAPPGMMPPAAMAPPARPPQGMMPQNTLPANLMPKAVPPAVNVPVPPAANLPVPPAAPVNTPPVPPSIPIGQMLPPPPASPAAPTATTPASFPVPPEM